MKKIAVLLLLLMSARVGYGQVVFNPVSVYVPQVAVGGDPSGLNYVTLVQLVNNNSSFTTAHLALFSDSGSPLSASFDGQAPQSALDFTLDSGVTRQIQITLNGAITAGWMQITYSPSDAQTTVIIQLQSGTALLSEVGVNPTYNVMSSTDFPAETDTNLNTGIAVANPTTAAAGVLVTLWDPNTGSQLGSTTLSLAANGHTAKLLTELFPSVAGIGQIRTQVSLDSCSTSACTANGPGLLATALRLNGGLFTTIPVVPSPSGGSLIRVLPQVAFGGDPAGVNYQTIMYLTTTATNGVSGVADIFDDNGNPIAASPNGDTPTSHFAFSVLGNRVTRIVLSGDNTLHAGWIRLTLPGSVPLIVNAVFQTFNGPNLTGEASVLESPSVSQGGVFVHVQGGVSNIGIAFANSQPTASPVTLTLFNSAGFAVTSQNVTLPPNGHVARFVTELFPQIGSSSFDGTLSIQGTTGFSAVALRLTGDKIAALPVGSTSMYRPSITNMRITQTQRSPGQVTFSIDVTDFSADLVTSTSTAVSGEAEIYYVNDAVPDDNFIVVDGTSMLNGVSGTLNGSFTSQYGNIPSGYPAVFSIYLVDSVGNPSNIVSYSFKF